MYYSNARWYDAEAGRFISEDPVQDGSNWYVYVRNNPLVFVDPTGLREHEVKEGETVSEIAQDTLDDKEVELEGEEFWEYVDKISEANELDEESTIQPGQKLRIPPPDGWKYDAYFPKSEENPKSTAIDSAEAVQTTDVDSSQDNKVYKAGIGVRGAALVGAGIEGGGLWDKKGEMGIYLTLYVGVGVEADITTPASEVVAETVQNAMKAIPNSISSSESIDDALGFAVEAKVQVGAGVSQDLSTKKINGIESGGVGGGVYGSFTMAVTNKDLMNFARQFIVWPLLFTNGAIKDASK